MLIYEFTAIVCSFILPRFILVSFGSNINGLVLSITRFLNISTLLDAGVGSVAKAALYKPLAEHDENTVSKIYVSVSRFYKIIGLVFCVYTIIIAFIIPYINDSGMDKTYVFFLTIAISIATLVQFLIGATNVSLINADQKVFYITIINIITLILNTFASIILINLGCDILVVKLSTSLIFAIRPLFAYLYCKKHFNIDRKAIYDEDPVKQKRDGFAHQLAETIHNNVDVIVLTAFSTYSYVSVYSVYALVTDGVSKLISSFRSGMGPAFGNMLVTEPVDTVRRKFSALELIYFSLTTIVFSCALVMIIPFIKLYTKGVNDIDYIQPLFSVVFLLSAMLHCLKGIHLMIIYAAGKFRDTKKAAYTEMIINLIISIALVWKFNLLGVAIGTYMAMTYRIIHSIIYVGKNILHGGIKKSLYRLTICHIIAILAVVCFSFFRNGMYGSYLIWVGRSIICAVCIAVVTVFSFAFTSLEDFQTIKKFGHSFIISRQQKKI